MRERSQGLRSRDISLHQGMLFQRCRSVHTIGMTLPITVAFLDASWRVIRVERAPAGRIMVCGHARRVLECHIGADVRVGDAFAVKLPRGLGLRPLYSPGCPSFGREAAG
jgi:uncharacterized membrane protein (UPF0127 family)